MISMSKKEKIVLEDEEEASDIHGDNHETYDVVEETQTIDEGKYQYCQVIFCRRGQKETGPYFSLGVSCSGSYFSDYHWEYELECSEVKRVEKVIQIWE